MVMKKAFVILLVLLFSQTTWAKVTSVQIGVDGLTCSMCTRSVEMAIKKLAFVEVVKMDLKQTQGTITFKAGQNVNFKQLAKAVKDAGFSVRYLKAIVDDLPTVKNEAVTIGDNTIKLVNAVSDKSNTKATTLVLLGFDYMNKKSLKTWQTKYSNFSPFSKENNYYFAGIE
jgi:copper chaperone CopZ